MSTDLYEICDNIKINNHVIVIFLNNNFYKIFEIWYEYYKKLNIENVLLICLDEEIYKKLQKLNLNVYLANFEFDKRSDLWFFRNDILQKILNFGIDITHSDLDCIWFKDFRDIIDAYEEDIVYSIAYYMPPKLAKKNGFVLCCGFFRIRSTKKTKQFFNIYMNRMKKGQDDQVILNEIIDDDHEKIEIIETNPKGNIILEVLIYMNNMNIRLINDKLITRKKKLYHDGIVCFHPVLRRNDDIDQKSKYLIDLLSDQNLDNIYLV
jgi:hypothetical protein